MLNREDLLSGTRPEVAGKVLVTVENHFEGYQIMEYKGLAWGISMRSKDAVQDFTMGCKQVTGGELTSWTELSDESRQRALDRMITMAKRVNANAVINFKFEQQLHSYSGNSEVIAFGNAVLIKPIKNYVPMGGLGNILAEFVDRQGPAPVKAEKSEHEQTVFGKVTKNENGSTFILCPQCNMKYGTEITGEGLRIKGFEDTDQNREGQQIICANCGFEFTVPFKKDLC